MEYFFHLQKTFLVSLLNIAIAEVLKITTVTHVSKCLDSIKSTT